MEKMIALNVVILLLLVGCGGVSSLHKPPSPVIVESFTTEAVFKNPESILFDPVTRQLFVTNVNGDPLAHDGNGFISKVAINGDIRDLHWITGLNGPKGMTLMGDLLYVADIDQLVIIDITNNNKTIIPVANAVFLNDVTHDEAGRVFISDMVTHTIHIYHDGAVSIWLKDEQLKYPNGLHVKNGQLYVACWGGSQSDRAGDLLSVDLKTRDISIVAEQLGNLDGVAHYADFLIVTDYMAGKLLLVDQGGNILQEIRLRTGAADLCVLPEDWEIIVVPMMQDNYLQGFTIQLDE
ncbi:MAG: hypothetical protein PF442_09685 [Desulfobulbaceae bacterium]|nr:hypothetical protein [Desulfobulbaceae bacterium]